MVMTTLSAKQDNRDVDHIVCSSTELVSCRDYEKCSGASDLPAESVDLKRVPVAIHKVSDDVRRTDQLPRGVGVFNLRSRNVDSDSVAKVVRLILTNVQRHIAVGVLPSSCLEICICGS